MQDNYTVVIFTSLFGLELVQKICELTIIKNIKLIDVGRYSNPTIFLD